MGISLSILLLMQAAGEPVATTDLPSALAAVYRDNPGIAADREGLKVLDEDVATARAAGRPSLLVEGSLARSELDVVGTGGIVGIRLAQPVYRGGRVTANVRAAETNVLAGRQSLRESEIDLMLDMIRAYSAVLRDRENLMLYDQTVAALRGLVGGEETRLSLGERTVTDVAQTRARLAGELALREAASQRLAQSQQSFVQLVGSQPGTLAPLPPLPALPPTEPDALAQALDANPAVERARLAAQVARFQTRAAVGNLLPTIDASASVQRRDEIVQILNRDVRQSLGTGTITVTIPIYQGGGEYAAIRRARHVTNVRELEIVEAERTVGYQVAVAWNALRAARAATVQLEQVVTENETALRGTRRETELGSRTVLDLLNAEAELRNAQIALSNSRHETYVAGASLLAATGALSPESFGATINRYAPEAHFEQVADRWIGTRP
ncbi:TolC family type I secretion outer membrane protein [Sphingomonas jejuensis]|uniref:TolC family type I secretion outer membrane protein n=1 Tax=Sphingomonas jejuensis TaxID=904715 RepID=A0ABX0XIX7_9SPHN|nr:TolC family type I secretion outer membrane protein [Sphingomonas jejuensis]